MHPSFERKISVDVYTSLSDRYIHTSYSFLAHDLVHHKEDEGDQTTQSEYGELRFDSKYVFGFVRRALSVLHCTVQSQN
jgi:hypothetical protein